MRQIDISQDATAILEKEFTGLHSGGGRSSPAAKAQPITHWPSFAKFENIAELHPYQWLRTPHAKSVRSFSAWRGK